MAAKGVTYPVPTPRPGTATVVVPVVLAPLTATVEPPVEPSTVKQLAALGVG